MSQRARRFVAAGLVVLGVLFIVIGAARSEVKTVLRKATTVCLECIGIG